MALKMIKIDPYLAPYENDIKLHIESYKRKRKELTSESLIDFAAGHHYFGIHRTEQGWVYREWAPAAEKMFFTGDFNGWDISLTPMNALGNGVFEVTLPKNALAAGQKVQAILYHNGNLLRRVPTYATRVVQDPQTLLWCAEIEEKTPFAWTDKDFTPARIPFIYECHIGMAGEEGRVSSFSEFTRNILPRIQENGYNTIQIMAIMEHPYYGSFGYQVSNFFAPSSRFGRSEDLKELINTAHQMGIAVLLDVVHSHAVRNTGEGLNEFDGTVYQFFHKGPKGDHSAWGTKLFNYGKNEVIHFLLSNLRYWMEEYHFDGFRFDGVTSMLYHDHGLGSAFTDYSMYFSLNTDIEALTYLRLANELIHEIKSNAITICEDMSGMPGMCLKLRQGGVGFDYRLSMGVPDLWIKTLKEVPDEHWDMGKLYYELTSRRPHEKNIGYAESHDQALVGDKTLMFRLCDADMYTSMSKSTPSLVIERGMALHKMIRLLTASLAGEGYLNFMGNEFGHPEWIDFPREGNNWSYHYCRRQWSLTDNKELRYHQLGDFDKGMIHLLQTGSLQTKPARLLWLHQADKVIIFEKGSCIFAFNFNPEQSFEGYLIPTVNEGKYKAVLSTDETDFGGQGRVDMLYRYSAHRYPEGHCGFPVYLPARTATVFKRQPR